MPSTSRCSTSHRSCPAAVDPSSFPLILPVANPAPATLTITTTTIISKLLSFSHVTHSHISSLLIIGVSHHLFGKIIYFFQLPKKSFDNKVIIFSKKMGSKCEKNFSFDVPTMENVVLMFILISLS